MTDARVAAHFDDLDAERSRRALVAASLRAQEKARQRKERGESGTAFDDWSRFDAASFATHLHWQLEEDGFRVERKPAGPFREGKHG